MDTGSTFAIPKTLLPQPDVLGSVTAQHSERLPSHSQVLNAANDGLEDDSGAHLVKSEPEGKTEPMTIKQILASLDGVFPMDQAVIDGQKAPPTMIYSF